MSDHGHPTRALRDYRGEARVEPLREHAGVGPWDGHLQLAVVHLPPGARFRVSVGWRGTLPDAPPLAPGQRAGWATDSITLPDLHLARAVFEAAERDLRAARAPDLRALARALDRGD